MLKIATCFKGQKGFLTGLWNRLIYVFTGVGGAFYNVKANDKLVRDDS